ncbi:hypothetical protein RCL1_003152 [Eukaryota sp. TZLM3-RCL]
MFIPVSIQCKTSSLHPIEQLEAHLTVLDHKGTSLCDSSFLLSEEPVLSSQIELDCSLQTLKLVYSNPFKITISIKNPSTESFSSTFTSDVNILPLFSHTNSSHTQSTFASLCHENSPIFVTISFTFSPPSPLISRDFFYSIISFRVESDQFDCLIDSQESVVISSILPFGNKIFEQVFSNATSTAQKSSIKFDCLSSILISSRDEFNQLVSFLLTSDYKISFNIQKKSILTVNQNQDQSTTLGNSKKRPSSKGSRDKVKNVEKNDCLWSIDLFSSFVKSVPINIPRLKISQIFHNLNSNISFKIFENCPFFCSTLGSELELEMTLSGFVSQSGMIDDVIRSESIKKFNRFLFYFEPNCVIYQNLIDFIKNHNSYLIKNFEAKISEPLKDEIFKNSDLSTVDVADVSKLTLINQSNVEKIESDPVYRNFGLFSGFLIRDCENLLLYVEILESSKIGIKNIQSFVNQIRQSNTSSRALSNPILTFFDRLYRDCFHFDPITTNSKFKNLIKINTSTGSNGLKICGNVLTKICRIIDLFSKIDVTLKQIFDLNLFITSIELMETEKYLLVIDENLEQNFELSTGKIAESRVDGSKMDDISRHQSSKSRQTTTRQRLSDSDRLSIYRNFEFENYLKKKDEILPPNFIQENREQVKTTTFRVEEWRQYRQMMETVEIDKNEYQKQSETVKNSSSNQFRYPQPSSSSEKRQTVKMMIASRFADVDLD